MAKKYVYAFGAGGAEGRADMRNLLGGKGANLAEMSNLGLPVPVGFTLTTDVCTAYYANERRYPASLEREVRRHLKQVEREMGRTFGDAQHPLLVSVRSGARVSMPGMMDTILNLGLNDDTVQGLILASGDPRFAYDSYRRFVQMYGDVVLEVDKALFEAEIEKAKTSHGVELDTDLGAHEWADLVRIFKEIVQAQTKQAFPEDPGDQLWGAVGAVFGSWMNERASVYRDFHNISSEWGTAVNVQSMVFGNMGDDCATGVAFTRDPSTGERCFFGEYLVNAQGEDVVAGIRTPQPINVASKQDSSLPSLEEQMPKVYRDLERIYRKLEKHYRDMQDIEFTIERGRLWMLQTRTGKRTAAAALRIACEMVDERLISKSEALQRVDAEQLDQLLHPRFDPSAARTVVAKGLPASPGAATGQIVFTAATAETWAEEGKDVILVRVETSPEDIKGMLAAKGILTARGGMTSHAAVVARGWGKCCVAGCGDVRIDYAANQFSVNGVPYAEGEWISLDGGTGEVMQGQVPTVEPEPSGDFERLLGWADAVRRLRVRTNADTPEDSKKARAFGAEGIGLCRTEHMFFEGERITAMREMILAEDTAGRERALAKLLPFQRDDFVGIFEAMDGLPVTIRLLDPPLHEFLPHEPAAQEEMAQTMGITVAALRDKVAALHEFNPMHGHRGCRLGLTYPEIYQMQAQAIFEAACQAKKQGIRVLPEVMIPLVGDVSELARLRRDVVAIAEAILRATRVKLKYLVGTMIEVPRAALTADAIAKEAEFFSFGTNDLTQMTYGFSRDDAGAFISEYLEQGILEQDPFQVLDQTGVGQLVAMAAEKGRAARKDLKLGICGEHGGDPASVKFCHRVGLDYVSCSPFRVPIARLAAAQAALEDGAGKGAGRKPAKRTPAKKTRAKRAGTKKSARKKAVRTARKKVSAKRKTTKRKTARKAPARRKSTKRAAVRRATTRRRR